MNLFYFLYNLIEFKTTDTLLKLIASDAIIGFKLISKKGYKTPDLLKFLMRQNFYYSMNGIFTFPFMELGLLHDYLHMADIYKIKVEKYGGTITSELNVLSKNLTVFTSFSIRILTVFFIG